MDSDGLNLKALYWIFSSMDFLWRHASPWTVLVQKKWMFYFKCHDSRGLEHFQKDYRPTRWLEFSRCSNSWKWIEEINCLTWGWKCHICCHYIHIWSYFISVPCLQGVFKDISPRNDGMIYDNSCHIYHMQWRFANII